MSLSSEGIEEETKIVNKLEGLCQERYIELVRARNKVQYGDLISQFMEELVASDQIMTVFSEKYLESEFCKFSNVVGKMTFIPEAIHQFDSKSLNTLLAAQRPLLLRRR